MHHALIVAGGAGSRLWPLTRGGNPKQFLPLADGRSLIEHAWTRIDGLIEPNHRWVCADESLRTRVRRLLPGLAEARYLGEPEGKDTLVAMAFASSVIAREDPEALVAVFTADHAIEPAEALREGFAAGFRLVQLMPDALVTFGIAPKSPSTGYGYLEIGEHADAEGARVVLRYHEKPDRATAESYCAARAGRFLWNSGMFLWKARTFLELLARHRPDVADAMERITAAWGSPARAATMEKLYAELPRISVDHGLMEPVANENPGRIMTIPLSLEWSDIGSWSSYGDVFPRDAEGNVSRASLSELLECRGTMVFSEDPSHLVAAVGCEDLVIVHTPTATLVCRKDRAESVKELQRRIASSRGNGYA